MKDATIRTVVAPARKRRYSSAMRSMAHFHLPASDARQNVAIRAVRESLTASVTLGRTTCSPVWLTCVARSQQPGGCAQNRRGHRPGNEDEAAIIQRTRIPQRKREVMTHTFQRSRSGPRSSGEVVNQRVRPWLQCPLLPQCWRRSASIHIFFSSLDWVL